MWLFRYFLNRCVYGDVDQINVYITQFHINNKAVNEGGVLYTYNK